VLHVTNGDSAVEILSQAGVQGEFLPWRDVLHEGPVDASLPLEELSAHRAEFISQAGWGDRDLVRRQFMERDGALRAAGGHDEIVLWFEHDLYDQLQLIQLLAWFEDNPHPNLTLICEPEYLGIMAPERAAALFHARRRVNEQQLRAGRAAWKTFGSGDPSRLQRLDTKTLKFLPAALRRLMQEYPWTGVALSRLEQEVVDALEFSALTFREIFGAIQEREDPLYLADTVALWHLGRMEREGLLAHDGEEWTLVQMHKARIEPRWIGGVRVDSRCPWRWDPGSARLVALA
jgi:hypothetical protein